ncbi:hypothetical protein PFISCL1PPCAC_15864, partial [Pristionchus fissidentatus]
IEVLTRVISQLNLKDRLNVRVSKRMVEAERCTLDSVAKRNCEMMVVDIYEEIDDGLTFFVQLCAKEQKDSDDSISCYSFRTYSSISNDVILYLDACSSLDTVLEVFRILQHTIKLGSVRFNELCRLSETQRVNLLSAFNLIENRSKCSN